MGNLDQSDIMLLASEGRAEDLQAELRAKCFQPDGGLYYFTKVVLGYRDLEPDFHLPFCNHVQGTIADLKRGYLLPRGHFKSTIVGKSYPLWRLAGGNRHLRPDIDDPRNLRIGIVGEDRDVAAKDLKDPKWHLEHNQMLRWLFPEICPANTGDHKWGAYSFSIPRPRSFDEETMTAIGVGTKDTGFHYDILIYEDIVGEKAGKSKSGVEMKGIIDWFQVAPGLLVDQRYSEELIIGTRWKHGKADLYGWIMAECPYELKIDPTVEKTEKPKRLFGFKWYQRAAIERNRETGEETIAFKSRFTKDVLDAVLNREKIYNFSCQYLNKPTAPEGTAFKDEMLKSYRIGNYDDGTPGGKAGLLIPNDGTPPVKLFELSRITFYDPSSGGRKADCENAIIALGCAPDKRKFVLAAWSANCGFRQAIERWMTINDQFMCWPNYYEAVGAHKEVSNIVYERRKEYECVFCKNLGHPGVHHRRLEPEKVSPPGGASAEEKTTRILTFAQADVEDGLIYLGERHRDLRTQIIEFPYGEFVDQFDALAYAIWKIKPSRSVQMVEDEQRDADRMKDRQPYTQQQYVVGGYS